MNFLEVALLHASRGYPVFPCQQDKRPKSGLTDWENAATTDEDQIRAWWAEDPEFLPAIPPGRVGLAVIDVDRHDGKEDGFDSLDSAGVQLTTEVFGTSISGKGIHYWHRHDVGSVNGIFPGVDRKARGGYVVVPYELPPPSAVTSSLPPILAGGKTADVERHQYSNAQLNSWLREVGDGDPDEAIWDVVDRFQPKGNQQMSVSIARVVSLASDGHPGAHAALDRMLEIWLSEEHYSGDPEEEFQANVRSAIEKFGKWPEDTSAEDRFYKALANPPEPPLNREALRNAAVIRWKNRTPNWESHADKIRPVLEQRLSVLATLGSSDTEAIHWMEETVRKLEEASH